MNPETSLDRQPASARSVELSIVVPTYDEEDNVAPLYQAILATVPDIEPDFELLFVDDGSTDATLARLTELAACDDRVRVIALRRNYGQTPAMVAGIDHARGNVLITMDADLQNDPVDIPRLLDRIRDGHDIVVGWRQKRKDNLYRRIPSIIANKIIAYVTGVYVRDNGCTLKAYRHELIKKVHLYGEMHRFIPAMASIHGCRLSEIEVKHHPRKFGHSKYNMSRIWKVIIDIITIKTLIIFAKRPLYSFNKMAIIWYLLSFYWFLSSFYMSNFVQDGSSSVYMAVSILCGSLAIFLTLIGMMGALVHHQMGQAWSEDGFVQVAWDEAGRRTMTVSIEKTTDPTVPNIECETTEMLSVVVPVLPDGGTRLSEVHRRYRDVLGREVGDVEFVYVVGQENAPAVAALEQLKKAGDSLTAIVLDRWDGEGSALRRALRHTHGEIIMTLPAHLQVDPDELPKVLAEAERRDMVVARRQPLTADVDTVESTMFHWLIKMLFGRSFEDLVCRVRAGHRRVFGEIVGYGMPQHLLPLVAAERGFRLDEVEVRAGPEARGGQSGPLAKLLARCRLALDSLTLFVVLKFIRKPLRFFGAIGLPLFLVGLVYTGALAVGRLFFAVPLADRPALILGVLLIVLGIQIIALGLIGEIIIFAAGKRIKDYTVEKIL